MDNKRVTTIIKNENKNKIVHAIAIAAIIFIVFISLPVICQSHLESDEPPSFKYSREANENVDHTHHNDHHHHHHDHHHDPHHDFEENNKRLKRNPGTTKRTPLDMASIWLHSIGSTLLISAAPFLLLYIIPLDNTESMRPRLKILLAFASGGLLGDAFLHLIPHASHSHHHGHEEHAHDHHNHDHNPKPHAHEHDDHSHWHDEGTDHSHSHGHDMSIGIWILGGIIAFLVVDKLVRIIKGNGHGHSHGGEKTILPTSEDESEKEEKVNNKEKNEKHNNKIKNKKDNIAHEEKENDVAISGYLNLAADFAHNFTDGLAIGASYLAGNSIGIITTITILMHEVPHEIGDFAILIKAGCSKKKAMMLQLVTAMGALAGTALALIGAADSDSTPTWVMPFTAGGFIYIATVSVLPELLEGSTKLGQSLKEIAALLAGVVIMVFIAMYE